MSGQPGNKPDAGFKRPKNRKKVPTSTPIPKNRDDSASSCNLSSRPPHTSISLEAGPSNTPRASTPTRDEAHLSFDISSISERSLGTKGHRLGSLSGQTASGKKVPLVNSRVNSSSQSLPDKSFELMAAYNDYLLSLQVLDQDKRLGRAKEMVQSDLRALSDYHAELLRKAVEIQEKISAVTVLGERQRLLEARQAVASDLLPVLSEVEPAVSGIAAAVAGRADHLEVVNITADPGEVATVGDAIAQQLRLLGEAAGDGLSASVRLLEEADASIAEVRARHSRVSSKLIKYQSAAITETMLTVQACDGEEETEEE